MLTVGRAKRRPAPTVESADASRSAAFSRLSFANDAPLAGPAGKEFSSSGAFLQLSGAFGGSALRFRRKGIEARRSLRSAPGAGPDYPAPSFCAQGARSWQLDNHVTARASRSLCLRATCSARLQSLPWRSCATGPGGACSMS